jgi:hypothetical protein
MNWNSVKYSQGMNLLQLIIAKMTYIKNVGHANALFSYFLNHNQAEYKLMWETLTLLYMLMWVVEAVLKEILY